MRAILSDIINGHTNKFDSIQWNFIWYSSTWCHPPFSFTIGTHLRSENLAGIRGSYVNVWQNHFAFAWSHNEIATEWLIREFTIEFFKFPLCSTALGPVYGYKYNKIQIKQTYIWMKNIQKSDDQVSKNQSEAHLKRKINCAFSTHSICQAIWT